MSVFDAHLPRLLQDFRVITWDYRGTYGSTLGPGAPVDVEAHASDLGSVLVDAGVQRAAFVGWSMGVQVGLELWQRSPERIESFVFMNGTFGRALDTVRLPLAGSLLPPLIQLFGRLHFLGKPLLRKVGGARITPLLLRKVGFVAPTFDDELLRRVIADFEQLDFSVYFRLLAELGRHDGTSVLPRITVPTLLITGTRDILTPPSVARRMSSLVPGSELLVLDGASHYAAAEFPREIVDAVLDFTRRAARSREPAKETDRATTD